MLRTVITCISSIASTLAGFLQRPPTSDGTISCESNRNDNSTHSEYVTTNDDPLGPSHSPAPSTLNESESDKERLEALHTENRRLSAEVAYLRDELFYYECMAKTLDIKDEVNSRRISELSAKLQMWSTGSSRPINTKDKATSAGVNRLASPSRFATFATSGLPSGASARQQPTTSCIAGPLSSALNAAPTKADDFSRQMSTTTSSADVAKIDRNSKM